MKKLFALLLVIILSLPCYSQEKSGRPSVTNNKHFFGFGFSSASGMGFSYRMWHHDKIGVHISSLPYINGVSKKVYVNSAVSSLFLLREADFTKFYIYNSYQFLYKEKYYDWNNYTRKTSNLSIGLGIGFQSTQNHFSIAMQFGYAGYAINTDNPTLFLTGGVFMFYYF